MTSVSSYPHMTKTARSDFFKSLKKALGVVTDATSGHVKDYREVASNLARKMRGF